MEFDDTAEQRGKLKGSKLHTAARNAYFLTAAVGLAAFIQHLAFVLGV